MSDTSVGAAQTRRRQIDVDALAEAVLANERAGLARAITLIESTRDDAGRRVHVHRLRPR